MEPREVRSRRQVLERDVIAKVRVHEIDGEAQPPYELCALRPARGFEFRGETGPALLMGRDEPLEQELALLFEPVFVAYARGDLSLDESQHRSDLRIMVLQRLIEFDGSFDGH